MRTENVEATAVDDPPTKRAEMSIPRARDDRELFDRYAVVSGLTYTESSDAAEFDRFVLGADGFGVHDE